MLLANTFLADDAAAAGALVDAGLPREARLITRTGESYAGDGVWSGGTPETPSLISRRSELAELDVQIAALERRLAELAERRQACAGRRSQLQADLRDLASELETVARSAGQMRSQLEASDRRAQELQEELDQVGAEAQAVSREVAELDARSARLAGELERARADRAEAQRAAEAEAQGLRELQEEEQSLAREVGELSSDLARTRERHAHLKALLERLRGERTQREAEFAGMQGEGESSARLRSEAEHAIAAAGQETLTLEARRETLRAAIASQAGALEEHQHRITALTEQSRGIAARRQETDGQLQAVRMQEMEASTKMANLLDRTAEDYGVRLRALELEPEKWREESPFVSKAIREYTDVPVQEAAPTEKVASWYQQMTAPATPAAAPAAPSATSEGVVPAPAAEEAQELVSLAEVTELRRAVLEMVADAATDWEAVRSEMARLKASVDRIGNVNVDSIREQEELETRLQFLTDQRDDLDSARRHERDIIRELNKKSRERFLQTFEAVRQNFQALFRKLFGGGTADLILETEAEDILEAGIEMTARPPGKENASHHAPERRREGPDHRGPALRHVPGQAQPVLPARRGGRPAGRRQRGALPAPAGRVPGRHPVHHHHPQQGDDGRGGGALRPDDGGRREQEDRRALRGRQRAGGGAGTEAGEGGMTTVPL